MQSQTDFNHQFYNQFNQKRDSIRNSIIQIKSQQDKLQCLNQLNDLTNICKSVLYKLPQHDQRLYNIETQQLYDELSKVTIRSKFSFSNKTKADQQHAQKRGPSEEENLNVDRSETYVQDQMDQAQLTVGNLIGMCYRDEPSTAVTGLKMSNIERSIVVLSNDYSTAKLDDITGSIIFIPSIKGPIYITNAIDTVFIVISHQFRIHTSKNLNIYVSCKRPVIEKCSGLRFAQFPTELSAIFSTENLVQWKNVDDFNWIRKTKSINWSVLDRSFTKIDWSILNSIPHGPLDNMHKSLFITKS
jgi:hypothetical protein